MMTEDYKVFAVEPIGGIGLPVIITSVTTGNGRQWLSEYFVLIPNEECSWFSERITCDSRGVPPELLKIDAEFMLTEALQQAKLNLFEFLYQRDVNVDRRLYLLHPEVAEDNRNLLISYWMREDCRRQLKQIEEKTGCDVLREFLEMVCQLPHFGN